MQLLGLISLLAMILVSALVGTRLLWLARRRRRAPELALGLAITLVNVLGAPLASAGRLPGLFDTPLGRICFGLGSCCLCAGIACHYVFTWRVFRRDEVWATALVGSLAGICVILAAGLIGSNRGDGGLSELVLRARPYASGTLAAIFGAFLWTAAESTLYTQRMRRRLAFGLGDAVVGNRVLLWCIASWAAAGSCLLLSVAFTTGASLLAPAPARVVMALAALTTSSCWYLAFSPPAAYLRWVRRRNDAALGLESTA